MTDPTYQLTSDVVICSLDSASVGATHQVYYKNKRLGVNTNVADLLGYLRQRRSLAEISDYCTANNYALRPETLQSWIQNLPDGFVSCSAVDHDRENPPTKPASSAFWTLEYKREFLTEKQTRWLGQAFRFFYFPKVAIPATVLIVLTHLTFLIMQPPGTLSGFHGLQLASFYAICFASVVFHEIGHCAASQRMQIEPGPIGIAVFLIWPVLFADLSETWRLDRMRRCVVDAGGIYFHLIVSTVAAVIALSTGSAAASVVVRVILFTTLINLNPFLRFDGYWIFSDILGIPNLRKSTASIFNALLARLGLRVKPAREYTRGLSKGIVRLVGLYSVFYLAFIVALVWRIARGTIAVATHLIALFHMELQHPGHITGHYVLTHLFTLFFSALVVTQAVRLFLIAAKWLERIVRSHLQQEGA